MDLAYRLLEYFTGYEYNCVRVFNKILSDNGDYKLRKKANEISNSANSKFPCIYCKQDKGTFHVQSARVDSRTIAEIASLAHKSKGNTFSCARVPLFVTIPLDRVGIDVLHIFLRIYDVLFNLLIVDLCRLDAIQSRALKEFDRNLATHCADLEKLLADIGISGFSFYIGRESKVLKRRDLTGPEKIKLFQNLHKIKELVKSLPIEEVQRIIDVWQEFYEIHTLTQESEN